MSKSDTASKGPSWRRSWPLIPLAIAVVVALLYSAGLGSRAEVGYPAPAFALPDLAGDEVRLDDLLGQPLIVHFWATWCETCRETVPAWKAFVDRYGDRMGMVNINVREGTTRIEAYQERYADQGVPLEFLVLRDPSGRTADQYRLRGIPETWVLDAEGVARIHLQGAMFFEELQAAYEYVTGEPIDGEGVGPIPTGEALYRLGSHEGVWRVGTSVGLFEMMNADVAGAIAPVADRGMAERSIVDYTVVGDVEWAAVAGEGIFRRGAGTDTWERVAGLPAGDGRAVAVEPLEGRVVYALFADVGLYRSLDGGETWSAIETRLHPDIIVQRLAIIPGRPDRLYLGAYQGLYESHDGGVTWFRHASVPRPVYDIAFDPENTARRLLATDMGVMASEDGGRTFDYLMSAPRRLLHTIAFDLTDPQRLLIGAPNGDVYGSDDGGETWAWWPWTDSAEASITTG